MYKKVNDWAKWVAIDSDGWLCEYEKEPKVHIVDWAVTGGVYAAISSGHDTTNWKNSLIEIDAQEQEPTPWNGEGLPPVGTVCEVSNCGNSYQRCEILYLGKTVCVVQIEFDLGSCEQYYHIGSVEFRPIKTEREKIADKAIELTRGAVNRMDAMYKLYDAGMLRMPEGE